MADTSMQHYLNKQSRKNADIKKKNQQIDNFCKKMGNFSKGFSNTVSYRRGAK